MLSLEAVDAGYDDALTLRGVSLEVARGEIVAMIGANGAGKSTTLRTICGFLRPRKGAIEFDGRTISGLTPDRIAALGLVHVPEGRRVFAELSVEENLLAAAYLVRERREVKRRLGEAMAYFPVLERRRRQAAGTLSGGEQQMLAVARALMVRPKLLLMDEPSVGLAPLVVEEIFRIIRDLNRDGTTIFLVEQNAHMALQVAHYFYLLELGKVTFSGAPGQIAEDEVIQRAYLGSKK